MRRWGWIFALLVSVGLNAGILATLWVTRAQGTPRPPAPGPPVSASREEPPPIAAGLPDRPPTGPSEGPPPRSPEGDGPRERHPGPQGPSPEDGPFGENGEVGPEPGTVGPLPTTPPPRLREFGDRLGLSGTTRERFFALQLKMIGAMREGRWRIQQLRREVRVEMQSDRPDRDKIEARLAAIQAAQLNLERQTVRTILDTREILDGEAERGYLEFITRLRLGAGERRPKGPRPDLRGLPPQDREPTVRPGFDPRLENPRMNRPGGPRGGRLGRPRPFPRGERRLTPEERLERRRRFEEWRARQGAGQTAPPLRSEPEGETIPPPI